MSRAKARGTAWETAIVTYLRARGWPHAERRALAGKDDKGDIAGVAAGAVCIEAKNAARLELAAWLDEATVETRNADARIGAVWIRRRGRTSPADGYIVMDGHTFTQLLEEAGYQ